MRNTDDTTPAGGASGDAQHIVRPALTAEEWDYREGMPSTNWDVDEEDRHMVAALCLYGQPFGFSQDDVEVLQDAAQRCDDTTEPGFGHLVGNLRALAARIAALLPPSDSEVPHAR